MVPERPGFSHRAVFIMSLIVLISGLVSVILGGVQIGIRAFGFFLGYPIWTGVISAVTGILGIVSWQKKTKCSIIALMVMCIISSLAAFINGALACYSLGMDITIAKLDYPQGRFGCLFVGCTWAVPLEVILIILALLVFVTSIVCSAFCCKAVCGCQQTTIASTASRPGQPLGYIPNQAMGQQYAVQGDVSHQAVMTDVQGQTVTPHGKLQAEYVGPPAYRGNNVNEGTFDYTKLQNEI